ncbi:PWWP domain [Macleaya cordata]|uniref:PWWP domain n=1 Tax=Macleaya cordata TaxID=56857 RepID=A0A200R5E5_MACCD|nr:PWWP domain [Macleaya cordata]
MLIRKKRKRGKLQQQICIPKCCQQPRSRGPKPRTDFSLFISFSSPSSSSSSSSSCIRRHGGATLEFSRYRDGLSSIATARMDQSCQAIISIHKKEMPTFPLVQCSTFRNGGHEKLFSNSIGVQLPENESVAQNALLDTCDDGNGTLQKCDTAGELALTPNKSLSQVEESSDVWITPGSIVWAKTAYQMWWPAKIMGGKSAMVVSSDQGADGHVLVQYYGNHECAWVDPDGDISHFDDCFEERSSNPLAAFQDALKQALHCEEHLSSCGQLDRKPEGLKSSSQHEQPSVAPSVICIESSSSRTEDSLEQGRGKRKRKPKIHFDEVTLPMKSTKKVRRFKIMRYLGLTAPIGSPFSSNSLLRTAELVKICLQRGQFFCNLSCIVCLRTTDQSELNDVINDNPPAPPSGLSPCLVGFVVEAQYDD